LFCLSLNLAQPSTIEKYIQMNHRRVLLGVDDCGFEYVAGYYKHRMESLGIPLGTVLTMLAEDETAISGGLDYCTATYKVYGHCGLVGNESSPHVCDCTGIPVDPTTEDAFECLKSTLAAHTIGRCKSVVVALSAITLAVCLGVADLTAVLISPLCHGVPPAVCFVGVTCNKFTKEHCVDKYNTIVKMMKGHGLDKILGPILGSSSDGDSRRRAAQVERTCVFPP